MSHVSDVGPAWLGIGAQRAGTTWFTSMFLQHPRVGLSVDTEQKELHAFDRGLLEPLDAEDRERYRKRFSSREGVLRGEFTPFYLRALWVPTDARLTCPDDVLLIVLLRDPVERFASAMRWYLSRGLGRVPKPAPLLRHWIRQKGPDAQWGGMYAEQLDAWARVFPRDQIHVEQYERIRSDPQAALDGVWGRLRLDPVPLRGIETRSRTATSDHWDWERVPGLHDQLRACYEPGVQRLSDMWGIDRELWPNFTS